MTWDLVVLVFDTDNSARRKHDRLCFGSRLQLAPCILRTTNGPPINVQPSTTSIYSLCSLTAASTGNITDLQTPGQLH
jgi:hypothetical protein